MSRASELDEDELRALRLGGGPVAPDRVPARLQRRRLRPRAGRAAGPRPPDRSRPPRALPRLPARPRAAARLPLAGDAVVDHRRVARRALRAHGQGVLGDADAHRPGRQRRLRRPRRRVAPRAGITPILDEAGFGAQADWLVARGAARGAQRFAAPAAARARGPRRAGRARPDRRAQGRPGASRVTRWPTCSSRRSTPTLGTGAAMRTYTLLRALASLGPVDVLYARFDAPRPGPRDRGDRWADAARGRHVARRAPRRRCSRGRWPPACRAASPAACRPSSPTRRRGWRPTAPPRAA